MKSTDWKKEMEEAGCQHMDYIAEVKEEIVRPKLGEGWAHLGVVVYLEKKYKGGLRLRRKVMIEHDRLIRKERPELWLCRELADAIKAMDKEAGEDEITPLDLNQDWMKVLKDAGCPYMNYIKKAGLETVHYTEGDCFDAIVVYLEKEYSPGRTMDGIRKVDVMQLKFCHDPAVFLCAEVKATVKEMDAKAAQDEKAEPKA